LLQVQHTQAPYGHVNQFSVLGRRMQASKTGDGHVVSQACADANAPAVAAAGRMAGSASLLF
jgi:hypothetical protein